MARRLALAPECRDAIARGRALIAAVVEAGAPTYGVNTGLGTLSKRAIAAADPEEMRESRLLLSNAAGTGPLLADAVVRRMILLKVNTMASGRARVRALRPRPLPGARHRRAQGVGAK